MSPAEDASLGERVLGDLLDRSHILRPNDVGAALRASARRLGAADYTVYVVDREQRWLVDLDEPSRRLEIDATVPGRAFRARTILEADGGQLWMPILDGADRVGIAQVLVEEPADQLLRKRLEWLGSIAALLIVTKAHFGDAIENARRTRPMEMAAELRWALLPPLTYRNDHVEIAAMLEPAYEVAGDAFDYAVDQTHTSIALFDAMGHGLEATRMANMAVAAYRNARRRGADLEETTLVIDEVLNSQFGAERFVTALLLTLDMRNGVVQFVCAGHPRPLHLRGTHVLGQLPARTTVPLGLGVVEPPVNEAHLQVGDRLLLFTDGVTEAQAPDGSEFGIARLSELLAHAAMADEVPSETARRLTHDVLDHAARLRDDATLLILGWPLAQPQ